MSLFAAALLLLRPWRTLAHAWNATVTEPTKRPKAGYLAAAVLVPILTACAQGGARDALRARHQDDAGRADAGLEDAAFCSTKGVESLPVPEEPRRDSQANSGHRYFAIHVLDKSGASLAGARLSTINRLSYLSDQHGVVAFYEPELMGQDVFFAASRAGYELAADGFGNRGATLKVEEGGSAEIRMTRTTGEAGPQVDDAYSQLLLDNVRTGARCFSIRVVDQDSRRPVPLTFLRNESEQLVTDSQGMIAYCDARKLTGESVLFNVSSHGYQYPPGVIELFPRAGETAGIELTRLNIAERLYRTTGQGIHRESQLLDLSTPAGRSDLNGLVMAQDAVSAAVHRGQLYWIWGNTDRPSYPLGNFGTSGATSPLPRDATLPLQSGVELRYFVNTEGFSRPMVDDLSPASLPTWLSSLASVRDRAGEEQLFAVYTKPNPDLSVAARGLVRLDERANKFVNTGLMFGLGADEITPDGQPMLVHHEQSYLYYGTPVRVPARAEALVDTQQYQAWSALAANGSDKLEYLPDGTLAYGWKQAARKTTRARLQAANVPIHQSLEAHLKDATSLGSIQSTGAGAQAFSRYRQRFVRIFQQLAGISSFLGEVWYAEGDTPMGPWVYARKIISHDKYTFYSPWLHPYFEQAAGRYLMFEGSYTSALAGNDVTPTPRYDRNQIMYGLALDDARLMLPVAVYQLESGELAQKQALTRTTPPLAPLFFAPDRAAPGTQAVFWSGAACGPRQLMISSEPTTEPLFYAVPASSDARAEQLIPLYDHADELGAHHYQLEAVGAEPFAYVWPSPIKVRLPVADYLGDLVANAGEDQCVVTGADEVAQVTLDAAASFGRFPIMRYEWRRYGSTCVLAEGSTARLSLPAGLHALELWLTDDQGNQDHDSILVSVSTP